MNRHHPADIAFEPYEGPSPHSTDVFVYERKFTPILWPLGKLPKPAEGRQRHFERQLQRLATQLGHSCIPVHIKWRSGQKNQIDKGCIGHSFGPASAIKSVAINHRNEITHVILKDSSAQNC